MENIYFKQYKHTDYIMWEEASLIQVRSTLLSVGCSLRYTRQKVRHTWPHLYLTNTSHTPKGVKLNVYNSLGIKKYNYAADNCSAQASKGAFR